MSDRLVVAQERNSGGGGGEIQVTLVGGKILAGSLCGAPSALRLALGAPPACCGAPNCPARGSRRKCRENTPPPTRVLEPRENSPKIPKKIPQTGIFGISGVFFRHFRGVFSRGSRISARGASLLWTFRVGPSRGSVAGRGVLNPESPSVFSYPQIVSGTSLALKNGLSNLILEEEKRLKTFISCYRTPDPGRVSEGFEKGSLKGSLKGF